MSQQSDFGLWLGIALSVLVHVGGAYAWFQWTQQHGPKIKLQSIQAAVLVRKGKPRPKHLLPRIYQLKAPTVRRRRVVVKPRKRPRKRLKKRRRRRRRVRERKVNLDDIINRSLSRRKRDPRAENKAPPGQLNGSVLGTAERARKGSMYGAKITKKIEDNLNFPSIMTQTQQTFCKKRFQVQIFVERTGRLRRGSLRVIQSAGRLCKNAVLNAVKNASPYPAPPRNIFPNGVNIIVRLSQ